MNQNQRQTLRAIFEAHGLDPFDAFLLNKADWPQEARDLVAADNATRDKPTESDERADRARDAREESERRDRWEGR